MEVIMIVGNACNSADGDGNGRDGGAREGDWV